MLCLSSNPGTVMIPYDTDSAAPSAQQAIQVTGQYLPFHHSGAAILAYACTYKDINVPMLETSDGPIGYDGGDLCAEPMPDQ